MTVNLISLLHSESLECKLLLLCMLYYCFEAESNADKVRKNTEAFPFTFIHCMSLTIKAKTQHKVALDLENQ